MMRRFISSGVFGVCIIWYLMTPVALGQEDAWQEQQEIVQTLMEHETGALLQQQASVSDTQGSWAMPDALKSTRLKALYGVGEDTYVLVEHRGKEYLFAPGEQQIVVRALDQQPLTLKHIAGRCVDFEHAEEEITRCITPRLP